MPYRTRLCLTFQGQKDDECGLCVVVEWARGVEQHIAASDTGYDDYLVQIEDAFHAKHGKIMDDPPELDTDDLPDDVVVDVVIHRSDSENRKFSDWYEGLQFLVKKAKAENQESVVVVPTVAGHPEFIQTYAAWHSCRCLVSFGKGMRLKNISLHIGDRCVHCDEVTSDMSFYVRERRAKELSSEKTEQ